MFSRHFYDDNNKPPVTDDGLIVEIKALSIWTKFFLENADLVARLDKSAKKWALPVR